ncbi:MAG: GGDEF domain-containing phosphodiesterase, partial [Halieaceae bacterium]|nr:GGDEF domain-containing phosphodiesterase [Halieaceae bacterium]
MGVSSVGSELTAGAETQPSAELTDPLTGLLGRLGLINYLEALSAEQSLADLVVLDIEVSRFGRVNNSMGTQLGDRIIAMVAARLVKSFPEAVAIGRTHGDHFTLCLPKEEDPQAFARRVLEFLQRPLALRGEVVVLSVRVGVAWMQPGLESAAELYHAAEISLHKAKQQDVAIVCFDAEMIPEAQASHRLENDLRVSLVVNAAALRGALVNKEFLLYYQPIVNARSGQVHCFEALLRWHHPKRGWISPAEFIPMAEEIRLMDVLGNWILQRACKEASQWPAGADGHTPGVSVNLSTTQFLQPKLLIRSVESALAESGLPPERLKLEVTESAIPIEPLTATLDHFRSLGCQVALDDFGTGYSSFTQLYQLPLDYLKIDQSFIRGWESQDRPESARYEKLIRAILGLASLLELTPIVEGIERTDELPWIADLGCELVQGYVYAKAMPNA